MTKKERNLYEIRGVIELKFPELYHKYLYQAQELAAYKHFTLHSNENYYQIQIDYLLRVLRTIKNTSI